MSDIRHLLQRQAAWQKKRETLSWPDKIRVVEAMQETLRLFRVVKDKDHKPAENNSSSSGKA
jgi:hypothetical protein